MHPQLPMSYVLPIRSTSVIDDLDEYLEELAEFVDVTVVDGSDEAVFDAHEAQWREWVRHVPVDRDLVTPMGKVGGVLTGVRHAAFDTVVIADDDVRWEPALLIEGMR